MSPRVEDLQDDVRIEAEEYGMDDDVDSALGDDIESFTTSLVSSVTNYRYENGRRYHAFRDGAYFMPNDEPESARMNLCHYGVKHRIGGFLHHAPLPAHGAPRILDLGTGTGIWAIEMADAYPHADVLGNDLSPIQPALVPPNVRFEVDDIEDVWTHAAPFDLIHARTLTGCIRDWPRLMRQAFAAVRPGGWIEFVDFASHCYAVVPGAEFVSGCALDRFSREVTEGIRATGREPGPGPQLEGWVRQAGFVDVHHRVLATPLGTWAKGRRMKEAGALNLLQWLEGLDAMGLRMLTTVRGYSIEETRVIIDDARRDLKNPRLRAQHDMYVTALDSSFFNVGS